MTTFQNNKVGVAFLFDIWNSDYKFVSNVKDPSFDSAPSTLILKKADIFFLARNTV